MQRITTSMPYKEFQIAASTTASTAKALSLLAGEAPRARLILEARGAIINFLFGPSTVVADKTVTSETLADGNFSLPSGAIMEIDVPNNAKYTHVSVITPSGSGTAVIRFATAGN